MRSRSPPRAPAPPSNISAPLHALQRALAAQDRAAETFRRGVLPASPTYVASGPLSLLISGDPAESLPAYRATLAAYGVTHVVRVIDPTYDAAAEIPVPVHDLPFADGGAPPPAVIDAFLALLDKEFGLADAPRADAFSPPAPTDPARRAKTAVAVHCAAGVGRAPALVAIALIELGWDAFDAVAAIRARRRGAINGPQAAFLHVYVPRRAQKVAVRPGHRRSRSSSLLQLVKKPSSSKARKDSSVGAARGDGGEGGKAADKRKDSGERKKSGGLGKKETAGVPLPRMAFNPVRRLSAVFN